MRALLDPSQDQVSGGESTFPNIAIVVSTQALEVFCRLDCCSFPCLFQSDDVFESRIFGLLFVVASDSGRTKLEFRWEDCLGAVREEERSFSCCAAGISPECLKNKW